MKKPTFLKYERPLITVMVQSETPDRIKELIDASLPEGAEAFGMQFCKMNNEYRTEETYRSLIDYAKGLPVYVTNYRHSFNKGKTDDDLAAELITLAECGATLCDVMGDYFAPCEGEFATDPEAVRKQKRLIDELHACGAEVLMSSHVMKFTPAERVLEIALEQQKRGADICKIVTGAESMEQQIENLRIINLLKENLDIPFLFLSAGESRIVRRIGGALGCCMYLCVHEYDSLATKSQPLLCDMIAIRDLI